MNLLEFKNMFTEKDLSLKTIEKSADELESSADKIIARAFYLFESGEYESAACSLMEGASFIESDDFADKVRIMFSSDDFFLGFLCGSFSDLGCDSCFSCLDDIFICICSIVCLNACCGCNINLYDCVGGCCDSACCRNCCDDCLNS